MDSGRCWKEGSDGRTSAKHDVLAIFHTNFGPETHFFCPFSREKQECNRLRMTVRRVMSGWNWWLWNANRMTEKDWLVEAYGSQLHLREFMIRIVLFCLCQRFFHPIIGWTSYSFARKRYVSRLPSGWWSGVEENGRKCKKKQMMWAGNPNERLEWGGLAETGGQKKHGSTGSATLRNGGPMWPNRGDSGQ